MMISSGAAFFKAGASHVMRLLVYNLIRRSFERSNQPSAALIV
jgi:hypothetical protein